MSEMSETERFKKAMDEIQEEHVIRFYRHGVKVEVEDYAKADGLMFCVGCADYIRGRTVCCANEECKTAGAWLLTPKTELNMD